MDEDDSLVLSWKNVGLQINTRGPLICCEDLLPWNRQMNKKSQKTILDNVSGYAKSGSLMAIMGPSGSGKTTLLATISKRISDGVHGEILLNGRPATRELMLKISGFVPQTDLAIDTLTVEEHIDFMATLKMDKRMLATYKKQLTNSLLSDLELKNSKDTLLRDLSGGERKRLSLAVQMITDLPILFCDEPTTGLDSYCANSVVTVLRKLASRGKAVICSIHQPSSHVYQMFDQLCLMLPGGKLSYHGSLEGAKTHFESIGYRFPASHNPADYLLQILNPPTKFKLQEQVEAFDKSPAKTAIVKEIESAYFLNHCGCAVPRIEDRFQQLYSIKGATYLTQLQLLSWRTSISMFRNMQKLIMKSFMFIFTGLLISSPFIGLRLSQEGIQNIQGFHYIVITEAIFCQAYSVINTFPPEIPILLREMGNGIYKPGPYYFSKAVIVVLRAVLETLVFCAVVFLVVHVRGGAFGFLVFSTPVVASAITSSAYGCLISTIFENIASASMVSVPIDLVSYTFCGVYIQLSTLPIYLRWIKYLSRFYYAIEAISILQWQSVHDIPCSSNENIPCIKTGQGVLERYGFNESNLSLDFTAMFIGFCVLHFFGFLCLRRRSKQQSAY